MTQSPTRDAIGRPERAEIDGVTALWVPGEPELVRASLAFRAGMTDLPLVQHGWLHLLEHLCLHGRDSIRMQINGELSLLQLSFDVAGPPDEVSTFLGDVCRWLADPQFGDLEHESRVLRAESQGRGIGASARHYLWRYGARGPGVCGHAEHGLHRVSAAGLAELAAEVFTAGNAVLCMNTEPPAGLRLPLPPGQRRGVPEAVPCEERLPGAFRDNAGGVTLSGVVERSTPATLLSSVLRRRLQDDIRHGTGTGYSAWADYSPVDSRTAVITTGIDVLADARTGLVGRVTRVTRALADGWISQGELDDEVGLVLRMMRDDPRRGWLPWSVARAELNGGQPYDLEAHMAELQAVTVADLQQAAAQFAGSLLVAIDPGTNPQTLPVLEADAGERPTTGVRFRSQDAPINKTETWFTDEQVVVVRPDGRSYSYPLATAEAVLAVPDGGRLIVRPDGFEVTIEPTLWRDGPELVRLIDEHTPPAILVPMPGRTSDTVPQPQLGRRQRISYWRRRLLPGRLLNVLVVILLAGGAFLAIARFDHTLPVPAVILFVIALRAGLSGRGLRSRPRRRN